MSQALSTAFHLCYECFCLQPRIAVSYQVSIIIFPGRAGTYEFTLVQTVERYIT